jgi:hypothetical protein
MCEHTSVLMATKVSPTSMACDRAAGPSGLMYVTICGGLSRIVRPMPHGLPACLFFSKNSIYIYTHIHTYIHTCII